MWRFKDLGGWCVPFKGFPKHESGGVKTVFICCNTRCKHQHVLLTRLIRQERRRTNLVRGVEISVTAAEIKVTRPKIRQLWTEQSAGPACRLSKVQRSQFRVVVKLVFVDLLHLPQLTDCQRKHSAAHISPLIPVLAERMNKNITGICPGALLNASFHLFITSFSTVLHP